MKLFKTISLLVISLSVWTQLSLPVLAQTHIPTPSERLQNTAASANLSTTSVTPQSVVVSIIIILLGLIGMIFLCLMLYAGFTWMTSQGDKAKIDKAKQTISNS